MTRDIFVELELNKTLNYAMWQNYVPFIRSITIKNNEAALINNLKLKISFEPELASIYEHTIEVVNPSTSIGISPVNIPVSPNFLANLNERSKVLMKVEAFEGEESIYNTNLDIDVLSYDQWSGVNIMPEILCSFVTPNYQGVNAILSLGGNYLAKWEKSSDFTGYLTNNPNNVRLQMAAIFAGLKEWGLSYSLHAANFEEVGQKIRMADVVLEQRRGNCLDFSVTYASCLEAIGLNPIIIITKGHAFVGCFLEKMTFPECVEYDAASITKRIAQGINEIEVVECTLFRAGTDATFDEACVAAREKLAKPEEFIMAIDVARSRLSKVLPLPQRSIKDGMYVIEAPDDTTFSAKAPENNISKSVITMDEGIQKLTKEQLWERKLLDLGLRNPLVNFRPSRTSIQLMGTDLPRLEDEITKGHEFKIMPIPADFNATLKDSKIYDIENNSSYINDIAINEFENSRIRTFVSETELTRVMKHLQRQAKLSLEENGTNTLYLALGFLRWYESDISEKPRYAPLVMIPVDIVKKLVTNTYSIRIRDDEAQMNITLLELLKQDFGIGLSGLDPLPTDENGVDILLVFNTIRKAVMSKSRWDVEELAFLGIFSFSQFIMWNDIRNRKEDIVSNKVVKSLISGKMEWESEFANLADEDFDESIKPSEVAIPTSVDSSQMEAVYAAAKGESFVLFGPPGTGKSQTITNMIANALYQGKSVLFVAEKMAALTVVKNRLERIGLGPFCLELHSNKAQKRAVLSQLSKTLEVGHIKEPVSYEESAAKLYEVRQSLNEVMESIHSPKRCDMSLYQMICAYEENIKNKDKILFDVDYVKGLNKENYEALLDNCTHLVTTYGSCENVADIFKAVKTKEYTMTIRDEIKKDSMDFCGAVTNLVNATDSLYLKLSLDEYRTNKILSLLNTLVEISSQYEFLFENIINDENYGIRQKNLMDFMEKGCLYLELKEQIKSMFNTSVYNVKPDEFIRKINVAKDKWFVFKNIAMNKVAKELSVYAKNPQTVTKENLENLVSIIEKHHSIAKEIMSLSNFGTLNLGSAYMGVNTDFVKCKEILEGSNKAYEAVKALRENISDFKFNHTSLKNSDFSTAYNEFQKQSEGFKNKYNIDFSVYDLNTNMPQAILSAISKWPENIDLLREYVNYNNAKEKLLPLGGKCIIDALENKDISKDELVSGVICGINYNLAITTIEENETLRSFTGTNFEEAIKKYKDITSEFEGLTINELVAKLSANIPSSSMAVAASSELGILQKAIKSNGRNMSIRKLFDSIPALLRKMCPCMLMSPISVAQYIDPSFEKFDLVIFDEASQLPTSEAVGAIARGNNVIVVGDPNQLPPTSFFSSSKVDDENLEVEDLDSVLDDCLAISMPSRHLLWHYRSRHESLIAYSNAKYYDNKLNTFPSPNDRDSKVKWINVEGYYDKGASRCNKFEAKAIVDEVLSRLKDKNKKDDSIGVVTFSVVQQHLIEDMLEDALSKEPELAKTAYDVEEPIFIKNLENVQGDERDVILFSIGYGPDKDGKLSMNFGPLNNEGGWRRLNVAISRSRKEMMVFSCIRPEQIDLSRTRSEGVVGLKGFLEFAKNGKNSLIYREDLIDNNKDMVIEAIAKEIEENGFEVNTRIGSSKFKVDIGVVDPEDNTKYILGIMCDGKTYSMSKTSRDRNILQPSVLKGLGWEIMNVWVMDWFDSSKKVKEDILSKINSILKERKNPEEGNLKEQINNSEPKPVANILDSYERVEDKPFTDENKLSYKVYTSSKTFTVEELYSQLEGNNKNKLCKILEDIIVMEAPVCTDIIKERIAKTYGVTKKTAKFDEGVEKLIASQKQYPITINDDIKFMWRVGEKASELRTYRICENEETRQPKQICIQERLAGLLGVLKLQLGMSREDLVRETAKIFGFTRLTANVSAVFTDALEYGLAIKALVEKDGKITLWE